MANHSGHRGRVKAEFLARGMEGWSDHRVLELLLFYAIPQGDVNGIAHTLIDTFGSLSGVFDASPDELKRVPGLGEHSVVLLRMIPALGQRYLADRSGRGTIVNSSEDAIGILQPYFYGARNEMIFIVCLDGKGKLLGVRKISEGSIDAADINVRRLMEEVLGMRAAAIYIAHNHISNLAIPSRADWIGTKQMSSLLQQVGVELKDHIVFADDDAVSIMQTDSMFSRFSYEVRG